MLLTSNDDVRIIKTASLSRGMTNAFYYVYTGSKASSKFTRFYLCHVRVYAKNAL